MVAAKQTGEKPKVLITEDDIENQKFLELVLKRKFETDICDSEETLINKLSKNNYDVILMDVNIKGKKNGIELTRELKKKSKYKNIPVVCLSAHVFSQEQKRAKNAGVDVYLTKPVNNSELIKTLLNLTTEKTTAG